MKMKILLLVYGLLVCSSVFSQDNREVIKIEVDSDCKSYINKRTYKDEIYTKPIRIINTFNTVVTLTFCYKENFIYEDKGQVLSLWFNREFLTRYNTNHIYFKIDDKELI